MDKPLWGLRVQAPLGARVLSFVCCAPNDGFSPQSGLVQRGVLFAAAWGSENHTTALTGEEMQSPFGGWCHHLARWEACHWIRGSRGSPMNPVPLPPPQFGGATKGKRLNGQARRLTSPHLEVLCRTSTGDYKAPLCCERLMKGMLRGVLFCPLNRGGKGTRFVRKQSDLRIV